MTAQPLDKGLADEIERELITIDWDKSRLSKHMQESYDWDVLAARSLWAFGPDRHGPNVLLDDSLPNATNKQLLG
jgi:U5 small nuclear ribonucleoprotein component